MNDTASWLPSAPISNLLKRAKLLSDIRRFFSERAILEVETPVMSQSAVTDIHLHSFETCFVGPGSADGLQLYLMTSPEFHMKRLLAAGSGPIYQLGRCFRNEEAGRYHNPEFTMLEWYRVCFDMFQLMNEVDDLLQQVLNCKPAETISYQQLFMRHLSIDPLTADKKELKMAVVKLELIDLAERNESRDTLLQLLFTFVIEPLIGQEKPTFVYHFPASQAALAKISVADRRIAERFEVYFRGVELANGFHELTAEDEQRSRFEDDNNKRQKMGLKKNRLDEYFLAALKAGMPDCAGVALGIDRLMMIALDAKNINEVMAFTVDRA